MDIGVYKSLIQLKKKKELPGILFNADIVKKTNILPIAKFNDVHKLLEAHFGPEWKSNSELEFYTKLSLGNEETSELYKLTANNSMLRRYKSFTKILKVEI